MKICGVFIAHFIELIHVLSFLCFGILAVLLQTMLKFISEWVLSQFPPTIEFFQFFNLRICNKFVLCVAEMSFCNCFNPMQFRTGTDRKWHANIFKSCFVQSSSIMNMFKLIDLCSGKENAVKYLQNKDILHRTNMRMRLVTINCFVKIEC